MDEAALLERLYFFEVERKSKLQSGLSLPIGVLAFSVAIGNFNLDLLRGDGAANFVAIVLYLIAAGLFLWAIIEVGIFIIARKYKYIWSAKDFRGHYQELVDFSRVFPDAPPADETFKEQFYADMADCTTHNTVVNDNRAAGIWRLNVATYFLVVVLFLLSTLTIYKSVLEHEVNDGRSNTSTPATPATPATSSSS